MEIHLGTISVENNVSVFTFADELTAIQHNELLDAISEMHEVELGKSLFEITFQNKNEFVETINRDMKEIIQSSLSISGGRKLYYKHHLNFNRLFLNYLSSIKTFIDHNETLIKRKHGNNSLQADEFIKMNRFYFDNHFCYRFFVKLRNYALHCGLPLRNLNTSTDRVEGDRYRFSAEITFNPSDLLKNFDWGAIVTADLKKMPRTFLLAPLVEQMTQILIQIWQDIYKINSKSIDHSIDLIKRTAGHLRQENYDVCIFTNVVENSDKGLKNLETLTIPFDIIDDIDVGGGN